MVLAAGRGARMRPLSDVLPKPALPLPTGPLAADALRLVASAGARSITVNTWHLAARLERALGTITGTVPVLFSRERQLMGGAGGLALARDRGLLDGDGPVMVVNGDILTGLDLGPVVAAHSAGRHLVTMALLRHPDPRRWSRVHMTGRGIVDHIAPPGSDPPGQTSWLYPGIMVVSREALASLPGTPGEVPEHLWRPAMEARRLGGVEVRGPWLEAGTPVAYLEAVRLRLAGESCISEEATVDGSATIEAAMVGRGAVIGPGALVRRSVVAEGARVGSNATLTDSVVMGSVHIEPGAVVTGQYLARP
jgi:mannose-1-phosphate guanylyltransferase